MKVDAEIRICGNERMNGLRCSEMYYCIKIREIEVTERFRFVDFAWSFEKSFLEELFKGRAHFVVLNYTDAVFFYDKKTANMFLNEEKYEDGKNRFSHIITIRQFMNILFSENKAMCPLIIYEMVNSFLNR